MNLYQVLYFTLFSILQVQAQLNYTEDSYCDHDLINAIILRQVFKIQGSMATDEPLLDPLQIDKINKTVGEDSVLAADLKLTDVVVENLSSFRVTHIETNKEIPSVNMSLEIDYMNVSGTFHLSGRKLPIPFVDIEGPVIGHGRFFIQPSELKASVFVKLNWTDDDDLMLEFFDYTLKVSDLFVRFDSFSTPGLIMDQLMNRVANRVGAKIFEVVEEQAHEEVRTDVSQKIAQALEEKKELMGVALSVAVHHVECKLGGWLLVCGVILAVLAALIGLCVCCCCRRRRSQKKVVVKRRQEA